MSTASTPQSDTTEPVAAVRDYIASFNKGDVNNMAALCADPMSILDGMAPHIWHGATASHDWYRDVLVEGEHLGAGDYLVELGEPRHASLAITPMLLFQRR
jgi:ketosteroid isomerase-like protein